MRIVDMSVIVAAEQGNLSSMIRGMIRCCGLVAAAQWARKRNIRAEYFIDAMYGRV